MPFLPPNEQCQSTEGNNHDYINFIKNAWKLAHPHTSLPVGNFSRGGGVNLWCALSISNFTRIASCYPCWAKILKFDLFGHAFSAVVSVLWCCWLGVRKSIRPLKTAMRYWRGYLSSARCKWPAFGPADATATPSSLASLKSRRVYLSGASLPMLSWKRGC